MDGNAGGEQGKLVASGGLADDETGRVELRGEGGQGVRLVGDRARTTAGGVENNDGGFTDIATDETRNRRGGRVHLSLSFASL